MAVRLAETDRRAVARAKLVYLLPVALLVGPLLYALAGIVNGVHDVWIGAKEAWNRPA